VVKNKISLLKGKYVCSQKVTLICDKGTIIYFYTKSDNKEIITTTENIIGFDNETKFQVNRIIIPYDKEGCQLKKKIKRMLILTSL